MTRWIFALLFVSASFVGGEAIADQAVSNPPETAPVTNAVRKIFPGYRLLVSAKTGSASNDFGVNIATLDLPRPAPNPGPQRDIATDRAVSGADLAAIAAQISELGWFDRSVGEPCRIDWIERCGWVSESLANAMIEGFRDAGVDASEHREPYYYLSRFGPADRLIISRSATFGDGEIIVVNALADREGRINSIVTIPISLRSQGFETGGASASVAVIAAAQDEEGAIYLTLDTSSRCGDRPRMAGLLVKTDVDVANVEWVSPFNVSGTNAVIRGGKIYTADGGSCEKDYLYELDTETGQVSGRNVLPTAADFLVGAENHLLVDLYEGAMAFGFR